ncbi:hypothetical protein [Ligilactobacillus saerimneri]|uniref:hypothetical protein n=1 Tax=Ligilactobacillus saerimneri TaxID=228229 RepID=UPI00041A1C90|nr:hypothetical protein [Ligilactobacillus saerimneri]KRL72486.1 hypothetical protein FC54_GL001068 [Ligilactobacillus saerimneri DSM 16049]
MMIDDMTWVESLSPEALKRLAERINEATSTPQTKTEKEERLLKVGETAELLGMSESKFYRRRIEFYEIFEPLACGKYKNKFKKSDIEELKKKHPEIL